MSAGSPYRIKALEITARAKTEADAGIREEMEKLAKSYERLADQAEKNAKTDIVYEARAPETDD
jgi:hypothetical protein